MTLGTAATVRAVCCVGLIRVITLTCVSGGIIVCCGLFVGRVQVWRNGGGEVRRVVVDFPLDLLILHLRKVSLVLHSGPVHACNDRQ